MSSEVGELRALAHPVRLRILSLLTGVELSAAEVARELGLTHANASYHLRRLAAVGAVVDAGEERIRGGVAKRYRHPWDDRRSHGEDPPSSRAEDPEAGALFVRALAAELERRWSRRVRGRGRSSSTDAELWVESEVWREVVEAVASASTLVHSAARPPRTDGTVHVSMTAALFELADDAAPEDAKGPEQPEEPDADR